MNISEYKNIFENEESHFFYVSTHFLVTKLIKKYLGKRRGLKILDAGCGTGGLMKELSKIGDAVGIDYSLEAIKYAKMRGVPAKLGSVETIPLRDNQFDLVTCVDVIYHKQIKDDVRALKEIKRVLQPNGYLILRVPANKFLMSDHDRYVHTARRYSKTELKTKLQRAGFEIKFISFVHSPIFPLSLIKVSLERILVRKNSSSIGGMSPKLNFILTKLLMFEARLVSRGVAMPFGQGLIAVATK